MQSVLANNVFLCKYQQHLLLFDQHKAEETIVFSELKNSFELQPKTLPQPIRLESQMITQEGYQLLLATQGIVYYLSISISPSIRFDID